VDIILQGILGWNTLLN